MDSLLGMQALGSAFAQQMGYEQMARPFPYPTSPPTPHCTICDEPGLHAHVLDEQKSKENKTMYDAIKKWFDKHSDLLVTVTAIFLADHFVFGGKFRHKIENMLDGLIDKVQKKVEAHEA